jgi:lysine-N-methylase
LPNIPLIHPNYADRFQCIGGACEDTCCQGWTVPVDRATWDRYQALPASPLRVLIDANVMLNSAGSDEEPVSDAVFAKIRMDEANQCPLLTAERLCGIQAELGEGLLSHACATYPRIVIAAAGVTEKALSFSCPEAARLVLLTPDLFASSKEPELPIAQSKAGADVRESMDEANAGEDEHARTLLAAFWPIRSLVFNLVRNRNYPLWQRLLLLGVFCRRLDSLDRSEVERGIPAFLDDFEASIATGELQPAMEALPVDSAAQLDVVLRLAGMMLHKSNVRPRFVECIQAFTTGIGNGPGATLETLTAYYAQAYDRCYAPFFDRNPHIMENFLINTIVRCRFPFGKETTGAGKLPPLTSGRSAREFALLTAQFALMRGLLIGVSGHHGAAFGEEHVVHTVQAASKHFEHHPEFLPMAYDLLVESGMEGARGMAILLRNAESDRAAGGSRPSFHGISDAYRQDGR